MPVIVKLDVTMAKRKVSLIRLSEMANFPLLTEIWDAFLTNNLSKSL